MIEEAIILAGGLGTRIRNVIKDVPKPMAEINGKPFLEYLLKYIVNQGILKIVLSVGYKFEVIKEYFGSSFMGVELLYSVESEPLGTGGALKQAMKFVNDGNVFILNGDTIFKIDLRKFEEFHFNKESNLSVALKKIEMTNRYGVVELEQDQSIKDFLEKSYVDEGLINGGVYLLNKYFFNSFILPDKFSFEIDFLEKYYANYKFYGFISNAYFIDIGVPDDYERAKQEFERFSDR